MKFFATAKTPKIDIHRTDPWKNRHPRRVAANGLHIAAPADLAARKLVAMAERSEPRDGIDVQALWEAGCDIAEGARSFIDQASDDQVRALAERLQTGATAHWPGLSAAAAVEQRLRAAADGIIGPAPVRIVFESAGNDRIRIDEETIEHGETKTLHEVASIDEGLARLVDDGKIEPERVEQLRAELSADLARKIRGVFRFRYRHKSPPCGTSAVLTTTCATTEALA